MNVFRSHKVQFLSAILALIFQLSPLGNAWAGSPAPGQIQSVEDLLNVLETGFGREWIQAAARLTRMGPNVLPAVRRRLPLTDAGAASVLLGLLAAWNDTRSCSLVEAILDSPSLQTAVSAAECLGRLGSDQCLHGLETLVTDQNRPLELRLAAIRGLAFIKNNRREDHDAVGRAEDLLIRALDMRPAALAGEAVGSLRYLKSTAAVPALIRLTRNEDPFLAEQAREAIKEIAQSMDVASYHAFRGESQSILRTITRAFSAFEKNGRPLEECLARDVNTSIRTWEEDASLLLGRLRRLSVEHRPLRLPGQALSLPDGFRLPWVEGLLDRPLDAVPVVLRYAYDLVPQNVDKRKRGRVGFAHVLAGAHSVLEDTPLGDISREPPSLSHPKSLSAAIAHEYGAQRSQMDPSVILELERLDRLLPPDLSSALGNIYIHMAIVHHAWKNALRSIPVKNRKYLAQAVLNLYDPKHEVGFQDKHRLYTIMLDLDLSRVRLAERVFLQTLERSLPVLKSYCGMNPLCGLISPWSVDTPLGRVALYGSGDDLVERGGCLIVDFGGNDRVACPAGAVRGVGDHVSLYLDLDGDDLYQYEHTGAQGAGLLGTGVLVDLKGNDRYIGGHAAQGAAVAGTGILYDKEGNDTFKALSLSQGAAAYGTGILVDGRGNDRYSAGILSQAFGGTGGVGMLFDAGGDDRYEAGGFVPDQTRDPVRFLSMSQGFALGEPYRGDDPMLHSLSGGVGLLYDMRGNDLYMVDVFGQGAAYYYGAGLLIDGSGNDRYQGYNYTQGSGVHSSVGMLIELEGCDAYEGVHHSAGHGLDRGAGILFDLCGNDRYTNMTDCQGAGVKPKGLGVLIDHQGGDTYSCKVGRGYARIPRLWPSLWPTGLFLDRLGKDVYLAPGEGKNGTIWFRPKGGLGMDGQ